MASKNPVSEGPFPAFSISDTLGALNDFEKKHAPEKAYYAGNLQLLLGGGRVSVVGSRKPTDLGFRRAREVARLLVQSGIIVVSGLAEGIDAAAHNAAIEFGGKTVGVLGTPLSNPYPKSNIPLFERMAKDQLVISQFPDGYPSLPKNFPIRNRTMALISHATIIVEAGEKSGTIHQGWEALRLGRPLFLLESLTKDVELTWPAELLKYGAQVLTKDNFDELIVSIPSTLEEEIGVFF